MGDGIKAGDTVRFGHHGRGIVIRVSDDAVKCQRADGRKVTARAALVAIDGPKNTRWITLDDLTKA